MAKAKKETKPKYDPEFYHEDGWPKLPAFLDRRIVKKKDDQHSTKTKKQKSKQH